MQSGICPTCKGPALVNLLTGEIACLRCGVSQGGRLSDFIQDIRNLEKLPCGCRRSRKSGGVLLYCAKHLQEGEVKQ